MPRENHSTNTFTLADSEPNRFPHHRMLTQAEPAGAGRENEIIFAGPARYFVRLQAVKTSAGRAEDLFPEESLLPHAAKYSAAS